MAFQDEPIIIAGAGIAGLTTALFLKHYGITSKVIEKADKVTTEGAGIQITPNAFKVLSQLGLKEELLACGHLPQSLNIYSFDNKKPLASAQLQKEMQDKGPYLLIKRQNLLNCLYQTVEKQNIKVEFNTPYEKDIKEGVPLIGADGVWSSVRKNMKEKEAFYSGRVAFRALIKRHDLPNWIEETGLSMMMGPNAHFVFYPVDNKDTINLVFIISEKVIDKHWSSHASSDEMKHHLKAWPSYVTNFICSVESWKKWPLFGIQPENAWHKDNKVLIGDAAHAMVPFLAQGGAMAIEDAAILAQQIAKAPSPIKAFENYENIRRPRVSRVWHEAFNNGKRYHWQGFMAKSRNIGLRLLGEKALLKRYDWIYDWQPPSL